MTALLLLCTLPALAVGARLTAADHSSLVGPHGVDAGLDCALRNYTWTHAQLQLPSRAPLVSVFDALRLDADCNQTRPSRPPAPAAPFYATATGDRVLRTLPVVESAYFVDAARGDDANSGTQAAPFATISRALIATRASGGGGAIVLRDGAPFHLGATGALTLGVGDSGLSVSAFPGEAPTISGGVALPPLTWQRVGPSPDASIAATVWAAPLPPSVAVPFAALWGPSGRRAVRARWPNGNPEDVSGLMPNGYTKAARWLPPPTPNTPLVQLRPQLGTEPRSACPADACTADGPQGAGPPWAIFCCFFHGTGGTVENFTHGSFWGSHPGPPGGATFSSPGGMVAGSDLLPRMARWATPTDAVLHAFQGSYWGNWVWRVASANASSGSIVFGEGGWQEARGGNAGDYLYVENLREELDYPGEWFVDILTRTLFFCANGTVVPPAVGWVAGQLENIMTLAGMPDAPVEDIALAGLTFAFSAPTFLRPFTASGGGDWSFQDGGALRLAGTRNCSVMGSVFVNVGGNGVMVSGWNKGASITDSEFLWVGESAIVAGGDASHHDNSAPDALVGEGLLLARNLGHEMGIFVKQAGFLYHTMSANTTVRSNVFFNGPRAGINLNDGFGGGHNVSRNVAFNLVRETSDHGPLNTWDRCTYRWRTGAGGTDQLPSRLDRNMWVSNYFSTVPIDHDDGSNGYIDTNNALLYGGSKSLMGYNKHHVGNAMIYVDYSPVVHSPAAQRVGWSAPEGKPPMCSGMIVATPTVPGMAEVWQNNTCIASDSAHFFRWENCNSTDPLDGGIPFPLSGNRYYSPNASYAMHCGAAAWTLSEAQERGLDLGSSLHSLPTTDELLAMLEDMLR